MFVVKENEADRKKGLGTRYVKTKEVINISWDIYIRIRRRRSKICSMRLSEESRGRSFIGNADDILRRLIRLIIARFRPRILERVLRFRHLGLQVSFPPK